MPPNRRCKCLRAATTPKLKLRRAHESIRTRSAGGVSPCLELWRRRLRSLIYPTHVASWCGLGEPSCGLSGSADRYKLRNVAPIWSDHRIEGQQQRADRNRCRNVASDELFGRSAPSTTRVHGAKIRHRSPKAFAKTRASQLVATSFGSDELARIRSCFSCRTCREYGARPCRPWSVVSGMPESARFTLT